MGMYTKINIILKLRKDTPKQVEEIVKSMFDGDTVEDMKSKGIELPEHKFFEDDRRVWFPRSGGSCYFTGTANSAIKYRNVDNKMVLHIDTDFKNYQEEIDLFLDWISHYVDAENNEFLGYSRYEEFYNPTLYFFQNGKITSFVNNNIEEY